MPADRSSDPEAPETPGVRRVSAAPTQRALLRDLLEAHLAWEEQLGGAGLVAVDPPQPVVRATPSAPAPVARESRPRLEELAAEAAACTRCELHVDRTRAVFSRGSASAELLFVGEAPSEEDERSGRPFAGPAGELLDRMIVAMGLRPEDVYVCSAVQCRPPAGRAPSQAELHTCQPFLAEQLSLISPRVIVALGRAAAEALGLGAEGGRTWRGTFGDYRGTRVMPTHHPAFLLQSPQYKKEAWDDLKQVMAELGRPQRGR